MSAITYSELVNQFRYRPSFSNAAMITKVLPEAASCDFKYGEAVILSSSGGVNSVAPLATIPAAGAVSSSVSDGQLLLGWALKDASGTTGEPCPVLLARNVDVLMHVYAASATDAEVRDVAPGDLCELFRYKEAAAVGTGVFTVCSAAANATAGINMCKIVEIYNPNLTSTNANLVGEQTVTDTYALVWVRARETQVVN